MKKIKKLMALVIALAMVLGMGSMTALAEDAPAEGSIKIEASADGTVEASAKTFDAYKVFDVTYSGDNYAYTIPNDTLKGILATKYNVTKGENESDIAFEQKIIAAYNTAASDNVEGAAKDLLAAAKDAGITPTKIMGGDTVTGLALGYYVIEDVTKDGVANKPVSAVILTTNAPNAVVKVKATKPTIDKNIDEGTDAGAVDANDKKEDEHAIGDNVPYILNTKVPEMTGYTKYFFVVNDTLSKGLTFNNDVAIKVGDTTLTAAGDGVANPDYTVTTVSNQDGTTGVEIVFNDFYNKQKGNFGKDIIITYSATINGDAVIGVAGNPNNVTLTYSNNPNEEQEGSPDNPDKPKPGTAIGVTPSSTTYTYVTGLEIIKQDGNTKARLANAQFKIEGTKLNTVLVETETFEAGTGEGYVYYKLKDGSYTTTPASTAAEGEEGYNANLYDSTETLYKKTIQKSTVTKEENVVYSGTTGADGTLFFEGLAAGTYTLTELVAPDGYNLLTAPLEVEITWTAPAVTADPKKCTWEATGGSVVDGIVQVVIDNNTGSTLPSTGGIGTTIFYVVGAILVIGAGVVLVTKRRMNQ